MRITSRLFVWLRASKAATIDPSRALAMAGAWWVFWTLDLQAWQTLGGSLPAWAWLALSWGYGALALWWPRFIGGPAMLCGLSGACVTTLAFNSLVAVEGFAVEGFALACVSTIAAAALVLIVAGSNLPAEMPQRDAWTLCLACGQAVASSAVAFGYAAASAVR